MDGIEIRGLTVAYGEKRIFDGLDLSLRGGAVNVVLGSSGVGKTTLLNIISGLTAPDALEEKGRALRQQRRGRKPLSRKVSLHLGRAVILHMTI